MDEQPLSLQVSGKHIVDQFTKFYTRTIKVSN